MRQETIRATHAIDVLALTASLNTTPEIDLSGYASGEIFIAADVSSPMTSLTYYVAPRVGGTYLAAQDGSGAITTTVVNDKAYIIPSTVFGAGAIKIVANNAGNVGISLKS